MRLEEVSVANYRSIANKTTFHVHDLTTLIGPNNEGKSNLLRALALGMRIIRSWSQLPEDLAQSGELSGQRVTLIYGVNPRIERGDPDVDLPFNWQQDYPLSKQSSRSTRPTEIRMKFVLDETEREEFKAQTGLQINGDLPIVLQLSRTSTSIGILKQGPSGSKYQANAHKIATFIAQRVTHVLVPAVRTMEQVRNILNELANIRLSALAESNEYKLAIQQVNELRKAAVQDVQKDLQSSISTYLPTIDSVEITTRNFLQSDSIGDILIDDGSATLLSQKGDGVKSLFALALIQRLARERLDDAKDSFILLVDEPEAHLHSKAVHDLQLLFTKLSQRQQVILATHNSVFVNREVVEANILVQKNAASPARSVSTIRDTLGIQLADNLDSAEIVVLTEGVTDAEIIPSVLKHVQSTTQEDLLTGRIVFKPTTGAGKLRSHLQREKSTGCRIIVVLDNDKAGEDEAALLISQGFLDQKSVFILRNAGHKPSEIEDLIDPGVYLDEISSLFGRTFKASHFADPKRKWGDKFTKAADALGVAGDQSENLKSAKIAVSKAVRAAVSNPAKATAMVGFEALRSSIWQP
jgi:energy-coupling factor transporter ATP-binding protein EcfA2